MSRAYRITVSESVRRDIVADDEVRSRLELLTILPPEEMASLLRAELLARGFTEEVNGTLVRQQDATTVTVDPCNGEVVVKIEARQAAAAEGQRTVVGMEDVGPAIGVSEAKAREQLRQDLDKKLERDREKLQQEATRELERHLADLQPELGRLVNKVTREALKIQAARLGSVLDIAEDEQTGSLTIKVEV
jgi:hypothetical protein